MLVKFKQIRNGKVSQIIECDAPTVVFDHRELVLIELAGPPTATRAIWAHLMKHRIASSSDSPDPTNLSVRIRGDEYKNVYLTAKERYLHKSFAGAEIVYRRGFEKAQREFFTGGSIEGSSPFFLESFRMQYNTIPVLPEWEEELWRRGVEENLVVPLDTWSESGVYVWKMEPGNLNRWRSIVKEVALHG